MILRRYLVKEIAHTFLAVILVILLIAISNKFVRLVAQAASGNVPSNVLLEVILFQIPDLLAFLLPVGLFLSILLCFSRFFIDNEIPVMLACGVPWQKLATTSLGLGVAVMILAGSLTCYWVPKSAQYKEQLLHAEGPVLMVQTVAPGRFHSFQKDKLVFYVADVSSDRSELKRVFIAEQPSKKNIDEDRSLVTASSGKVYTDQQSGLMYFQLNDGRRYNGTPGDMDYSILAFKEYQRLLEGPTKPEGLYYHRTMPTKMLLENPTKSNLAELQWRLSVPLSAPLLALFAVPLSRVGPRQGRYGRLFSAVAICIVYYNLLTISKRWVASGALAPSIGVWWVHLLLLAFALAFLAKASGRSTQWFHQIKQRFSHE